MQAPVRVLHIGKYFPPFHGGMEIFLADLVCAQANLKQHPAVLAHSSGKQTEESFTCPSGTEIPVVRAATLGRLLYAPLSPGFPWALKRMLRRFRPDLLHLHLPNPSAFWALALPETRRLPWIVHWHADAVTHQVDWKVRQAYRLYRPLEQALLRRSARILATTPPYLESSPALTPWHEKARVVPLGLNPERLAGKAGDAPSWPARGLRILAVGRLSYYKGFEYLLRALSADSRLQLILVGEGEERTRLERLADALEIRQRLLFAGALDDARLAALMSRCDCLCLPSIDRAEAFGVVLLEAMASGKAVVVSDVPGSGMGWVVEHEVTGFKVKPASPEALADALRKLSDNREMRLEMGLQGRKRFDRLFHISAVAERIGDHYREVLSSGTF